MLRRREPVQIGDVLDLPVRPIECELVGVEHPRGQDQEAGDRSGKTQPDPPPLPGQPRDHQTGRDAQGQRPDQPGPLPGTEVEQEPAVDIHGGPVEELAGASEEKQEQSDPALLQGQEVEPGGDQEEGQGQ